MTSIRASRRRAGALVSLALFATACTGGAGPPGPAAVPASGVAATADAHLTAAADPTPSATRIDGVEVTTVSLGASVSPIDVVAAFGSLWVAGHHSNAVSRIDPATMQEIARIQVASGPGWFAVTDDAVWVNSQMGRGLVRIDPTTNTADIRAGGWPTCGVPAVRGGYLWQMACDAGIIMRVDLATNTSTDIYADDYLGLGFVGDTLVAIAPDGMERLDPETGELERIGDRRDGFPLIFDDRSIWFATDSQIERVAFEDAAVLATIPIGGEMTATLAHDRAWITQFGQAVHEVELATGDVLRTLHLRSPSVAREVDGLLWVTSFDSNTLSRLEP